MKVVSNNIFVKMKANALTSEEFTEFIEKNGINEFFVAGADATACVKSTCFIGAGADLRTSDQKCQCVGEYNAVVSSRWIVLPIAINHYYQQLVCTVCTNKLFWCIILLKGDV